MTLSYYRDVYDVHSTEVISFSDFLGLLKEGPHTKTVLKARKAKENGEPKEKITQIKLKLPAVAVSGTFGDGHQDKDLIEHSGLLCLDFDGFAEMEDAQGVQDILRSDDYIYASFISASGNLAVVVKIDPTRHSDSFATAAKYFATKYRLVVDPSGKNISRYRYLSLDPEYHLNESSYLLEVDEALIEHSKKLYELKSDIVREPSEFLRLIDRIVEVGIDITSEYLEWIYIGYAIYRQFSEEGLDLFHNISRFNSRYDADYCTEQYTSIGTSLTNEDKDRKEKNKATLDYVFEIAEHHGIRPDAIEVALNPTAELQPLKQKKRFVLEEAILASNVSSTETLNEPPKVLTIESKGIVSTIGTLGNFSLVYGKAKGKKSFLVQLFINAVLNQGISKQFITSSLPVGKRKIIVFDTEQGRYRSQRIFKRAGAVVGSTDDLTIFDLRSYTPQQRFQMVERVLYTTTELGMVFIDGIRDLVTSINDEEQSTFIASSLLRWTEELNIHICIVLHQNKGDENARGHLGTEMVNKAETALSTNKDEDDPDASIVQAEFCRDREFDPFSFYIDGGGLPVIKSNFTLKDPSVRTQKKSWQPEDFPFELHIYILRKIFPTASTPGLGYKDFMEAIRVNFSKERSILLSKNRIEDLISYYFGSAFTIKKGSTMPSMKYYLNAEHYNFDLSKYNWD